MNNDEISQSFDQLMANYGGILRPDDWGGLSPILECHINRGRRWIDRVRSQKPNIPQVHMFYVNNGAYNSDAIIHNGQYFIALYAGVVASLVYIFRRILADPDTLRHIGDPGLESSDIPILKGHPFHLHYLINEPGITPDPKDLTRIQHSALLIEIAVDFFVAHEFAHHACGHTEYFRRYMGRNWIPAVPSHVKFQSEDEYLASHAVEFHADSLAIRNAIVTMDKRLRTPSIVADEFQQFYKDRRYALFDLFFSISTFYRMMINRSLDLDNPLNESHPHPLIRHRNMSAMAFDEIEKRWSDSLEDTRKIFQYASVEADKAYSKITDHPSILSDLEVAFSDSRVMEHVKRVMNAFDKIDGGLQLFSWD